MKKILNIVSTIVVIVNVVFSQTIHDNLVAMNVDDLWNMNIKGEGMVVMDIIGGTVYPHPGISSKWRGTTSTGYDWYDPVYGMQAS
jgi:hypothetical protein